MKEMLICIGMSCTFLHLMLFGSALTIFTFWHDNKKDVYIQAIRLLISMIIVYIGCTI